MSHYSEHLKRQLLSGGEKIRLWSIPLERSAMSDALASCDRRDLVVMLWLLPAMLFLSDAAAKIASYCRRRPPRRIIHTS